MPRQELLLSGIAAAAREASLTGFEFAGGIPGTLGGAVVMNAGAYGGEMKDVLKEVTVLTPEGGVLTLQADELHMGYRTNNELWEKQENNIYHRIGNSEKEYQANEFAAAFLMPATEYLAVLNKVAEGNMVDTSKIAEYFNVSIEAAANRGKFLGYLRW